MLNNKTIEALEGLSYEELEEVKDNINEVQQEMRYF